MLTTEIKRLRCVISVSLASKYKIQKGYLRFF